MLELKVTIFYSNVTTLNIPVLHKKLKKAKAVPLPPCRRQAEWDRAPTHS
jgi:hypothetical protein